MRRCLNFVFTLLVSLLLFLAQVEGKESDGDVYEKNGNIFITHEGKITQLTSTGRDSEPILSPDGRWIAFNREIEGKVQECSERDMIFGHAPATNYESSTLKPRQSKCSWSHGEKTKI